MATTGNNRQITPEWREHHTSRYLAEKASKLDDKIYGSPIVEEKVDRVISDPWQYLKELREEKNVLRDLRSDVAYFSESSGGEKFEEYKDPQISIQEANAHVYHKFTLRSFTYASKIQSFLSISYAQVKPNLPKIRRQMNVLDAALYDISVSIIRFEKYAELIS